MSEAPKPAFTLEEIRAFRYLVLTQAVVAGGILVFADAPALALLLPLSVVVAAPLVVYGLRRLRAKNRDKPKQPAED